MRRSVAVTDPGDDLRRAGPSEDRDITVPLSALEHLAYCERQAALIHVEATWADSIDTARGDLAHRAVDLPGARRRREVTTVRALPVYSRRHGLHGICDLVEITGDTAAPVEYKVGPYHDGGPADLQLAGQALCLTEAGYRVPAGYVYSVADRRRHEVLISEGLISRTLAAARRMRALLRQDRIPAARNDWRCRRCSLREDCLPEITCTPRHPGALFTARPLGTWRD
jgi:CRISPR-associated exonuclease Cas4